MIVSMREGCSFVATLAGTLALAAATAGCVDPLDRCDAAGPGERLACPMPGWTDRAFDVVTPPAWDGVAPLPLVVAFHGGGGRRRAAESVSCPDGDVDDPACLGAQATARGYAVVFPDGTGTRPVRNLRTWNAGGGTGRWQCVSGPGCASGVDDIAYVDALLAELERIIPIDPARVFATGLSNGGAMSHRLACERADVFAAIAPVGAGNQFAAAGGACAQAVPVLAIHGADDPCWTFGTGAGACAQDDGLDKLGGLESTEAWAARNGCDGAPVEDALPDVDPGDGTTATRLRWPGCDADVELIRIDGGGHTWPRGHAYLDAETIGLVSRDVDGNAIILDFFDAHPR